MIYNLKFYDSANIRVDESNDVDEEDVMFLISEHLDTYAGGHVEVEED